MYIGWLKRFATSKKCYWIGEAFFRKTYLIVVITDYCILILHSAFLYGYIYYNLQLPFYGLFFTSLQIQRNLPFPGAMLIFLTWLQCCFAFRQPSPLVLRLSHLQCSFCLQTAFISRTQNDSMWNIKRSEFFYWLCWLFGTERRIKFVLQI